MNDVSYQRLENNAEALNQSITELKKAIDKENTYALYKNLGETLLWICTTEEWFKTNIKDFASLKKSKNLHKKLAGIRYAYNCFKHNMNIIKLHEVKGGMTFPFSFPLAIPPFTFYWTRVNEKFEGFENQKLHYQNELMDKEIYSTLNEVTKFLLNEFYSIRSRRHTIE